jgi:hypothetical protein
MKPLNINRESCSPVSSNCVIWQGPDIECIGLCKGATITEVTYQLAMELCNFLDSIKIENFDITCLDSTSCPPETFAELIKLIISYICNIQAQNGADGTNGNYTTVEAFAPGLNGCVNGGIAIRTFDGLTETQISEYFICNPEDGAEGPQGPQGTKGDYVIVAAAGSCPAGGYDIILYSGADDTVISTSTVCNGVAGAQGQGIDHISFTTSTGTPSSTPNKPGETDTYTIWGDFAETINLGTFTIYNGEDCDCGTVESFSVSATGEIPLSSISNTLEGSNSGVWYSIADSLNPSISGQSGLAYTAIQDGKYRVHLECRLLPQDDDSYMFIGIGLNGFDPDYSPTIIHPNSAYSNDNSFLGLTKYGSVSQLEVKVSHIFIIDMVATDTIKIMFYNEAVGGYFIEGSEFIKGYIERVS